MWDLPRPGIEPTLPCIGRWTLRNHGTTRKVTGCSFRAAIKLKWTLRQDFVKLRGTLESQVGINKCILSRVKQITSPGWMHETSVRAWCTGKTQRDPVEGWREGGSGWGTHVNPWLIHVNVWQKPLQYCKVISLQLIKINGKIKKNN